MAFNQHSRRVNRAAVVYSSRTVRGVVSCVMVIRVQSSLSVLIETPKRTNSPIRTETVLIWYFNTNYSTIYSPNDLPAPPAPSIQITSCCVLTGRPHPNEILLLNPTVLIIHPSTCSYCCHSSSSTLVSVPTTPCVFAKITPRILKSGIIRV